MQEVWKDIEGYEGIYKISNYGRVKSLERKDCLGRIIKEKILKLREDKDGYLLITLHKNKKVKTFKVHRLVAEAFITNPNNYPIINHKDENPSNNHASNLEWCTQKYNCNYGNRVLKYTKSRGKKVICITTGKIFDALRDAERIYKIHNTSISACCKGKVKTAGKHPITGEKLVWRYYDE